MASEALEKTLSEARGLSLRQIAEKKIHHAGDRFVNPFNAGGHGGLGRLLRWKLFSENKFRDQYKDEVVREIRLDWRKFTEEGDCALMFMRHASLAVRDMDRVLLVDPVFSGIFTIKDFSPIVSGLDDMPPPDHVLITHGHYDHLHVPTLETLDPGTHVVTPLGYDAIFEDLGMHNRTRLDWFQEFRDGGLTVTLLPCSHWTMRNPFTGPNRSLWGSYLLQGASGRTIYVSGDTGYFDRFGEIGREWDIDLAVISLGAYEPRWFMRESHLNPEEAVRAFRELGAKQVLVVHWGTFRLGDEPVHLPPLEMRKEMKKAGCEDRLIMLEHGQTLIL